MDFDIYGMDAIFTDGLAVIADPNRTLFFLYGMKEECPRASAFIDIFMKVVQN